MKIVIIGTSNSVIGMNGYISELSKQHEVRQLSLGRVPVFYHIKTIMSHIDEINESDLLIIDSYINDTNFYARKLGCSYVKHCENLYKILSTIRSRILVLFFPIYRFNKECPIYNLHIKLCRENEIDYIDFNYLKFRKLHFIDPIHISNVTSRYLGVCLLNYFEKHPIEDPGEEGKIVTNPYRYLHVKDMFDTKRLIDFKNSLISIQFCSLKEGDFISVDEGYSLLSIGYLNLKNEVNGVMLDDKPFFLSGNGYFHEAVNIKGIKYIFPLTLFVNKEPLLDLMDRESTYSDVRGCNLVDLLLYNSDVNLEVNPSQRNRFISSIRISRFGLYLTLVGEISNRLFSKLHRLFKL